MLQLPIWTPQLTYMGNDMVHWWEPYYWKSSFHDVTSDDKNKKPQFLQPLGHPMLDEWFEWCHSEGARAARTAKIKTVQRTIRVFTGIVSPMESPKKLAPCDFVRE